VNEWPLPTIRTVRPSAAARWISAATAAAEAGVACRRGLADTFPAQLRHVAGAAAEPP
jgi:hypothetical protein